MDKETIEKATIKAKDALQERGISAGSLLALILVGSRLYGAEDADSDYDFWIVYRDRSEVLSPYGLPYIPDFDYTPGSIKTQFRDGKFEFTLTPVSHLFSMGVQGNPNHIDALFAPESAIVFAVPTYRGVINAYRDDFRSMEVVNRMLRYSKSVFCSEVRGNTFEDIDFKSAYHAWRLLFQVRGFLSDKHYRTGVAKELIRAIRHGQLTVEYLMMIRADLEREIHHLLTRDWDLPVVANRGEIKKALAQLLEI